MTLTGGNIRNWHIYLPLDFFPEEVVGGNNHLSSAPRMLSVTFQPGATVETDIDGSKRILRERSAVRDFFAQAGLSEGDKVLITRDSAYSYTISKCLSHVSLNPPSRL